MLTKSDFLKYSQQYDKNYQNNPDGIVEVELKEWFQNNKYLDKERFVKLGLWKSKRPKKKYESNSEELIKEITTFALSSKSEEVRIKSLMILNCRRISSAFFPRIQVASLAHAKSSNGFISK